MLKAMIRNGAIVPLEPLPPEWGDGTELAIEAVHEEAMTPAEIDRAFAELDAMCAEGDPADHEQLDAALRAADEQAKAWMRREMGLTQ